MSPEGAKRPDHRWPVRPCPGAKSAAVMGPLVFGGISHAAGGNQRAGILAIGSFFLVGLVLLSRVRAGGPTHLPPTS